jgi:small conductance mechanosensitive channel
MADDNTTVETVTALLELGIDYGLNALGALGILVIGWIIANLVRRSLRRMLAKSGRVDATLQPVIANIVRYLILVFVLVAVLAQFGVQTTSVIAVVGAAGLAIGLALQGTMQNIAAGFMLLFLRPFGVGDFISAGGTSGTAEEIGLFVTTLKTPDGVYISVPNSQLWGTAITNYSKNPTRRIDLVVGIGYGDDIDRAQEVLLALAKADDRIHAEPAPQVLVQGLGESSVDLDLRCWTSIDDFWPLLFDLTKRAKVDIEGAGLSIPYPQRDLHIISGTDVNAASA